MSGLTVTVTEILGRPGTYRDFRVHEPLADVATALARLEPNDVDAQLRAESVMEGILVTGKVHGDTVFTCARCLKQFPAVVDLDVCELFATPAHYEPEDDNYPIKGAEMDLEPMLRDVVTLALPLNPHCTEVCKGLCASCGRDLVDGTCSECVEDESDPRWAGLEALKDKLA